MIKVNQTGLTDDSAVGCERNKESKEILDFGLNSRLAEIPFFEMGKATGGRGNGGGRSSNVCIWRK